MFNFLRKQTKEPEIENKTLASITYVINTDNDNPIIDIQINDYDEKSIEALGSLLLTLSSDSCFIETTNIIRSLLIEDSRPDILIKLFSKIHNQFKEKMNNLHIKTSNTPCIKPSEMR